MFTKWSGANLTVEQELSTSLARKLITGSVISGTSKPAMYFRYRRTREMAVKYLGLTREAAYCCAADLRRRLRRQILKQVWTDDGAGHYGWTWPVAPSPLDREEYDAAVTIDTKPVGGGMWDVSMSLYEALDYNHKAFPASSAFPESEICTDLEMDPDGPFGGFAGGKGDIMGEDFWYPSPSFQTVENRIVLYPARWDKYGGLDAVYVRCRNFTGRRPSTLWGRFRAGGQWLQGVELSRGVMTWQPSVSDDRPDALQVYHPGGDGSPAVESNIAQIGDW